MDIVKVVENAIGDALAKAVEGYVKDGCYREGNPLHQIFLGCVRDNEVNIKSTFDEAIKYAFNSPELKVELKHQMLKKIAQTLVANANSVTEKQVALLKQDATFKAKMTILLSEFLTKE